MNQAAENRIPSNAPSKRVRKDWPDTLTAGMTLAVIFVFYTMLAMTFGIALQSACMLAATGAAGIAWITRAGAAARGP